MKKKRTLCAKEENYRRSNDLKIKMENWASYRMAQTQPDSRATLKRAAFSSFSFLVYFVTTTRVLLPI